MIVMKWYVYIARARTGRYYTGITIDAQARLAKHNSGKGAMFAIEQGPFELVYCSSPFKTKPEARLREIQIKGWTKAKKEKLVAGEWK